MMGMEKTTGIAMVAFSSLGTPSALLPFYSVQSWRVIPFLFPQDSFSLSRLPFFARPQRELSVARATEV